MLADVSVVLKSAKLHSEMLLWFMDYIQQMYSQVVRGNTFAGTKNFYVLLRMLANTCDTVVSRRMYQLLDPSQRTE
jgi:hypothetical protein